MKDEEVLGLKGLERISELMAVLTPFITHLNAIVMPDEESSGSEDEDGDNDPGPDEDDEEDNEPA